MEIKTILFDYLHIYHFILFLFILQSAGIMQLRKKLVERDKLLSNVQKEVEAMLLCERGMADRIKQQQTQMRGITSRQDKLEINESSQVNYKQAIALMRRGASADELVEACDISRGEVDLISHLQKMRNNQAGRRAA